MTMPPVGPYDEFQVPRPWDIPPPLSTTTTRGQVQTRAYPTPIHREAAISRFGGKAPASWKSPAMQKFMADAEDEPSLSEVFVALNRASAAGDDLYLAELEQFLRDEGADAANSEADKAAIATYFYGSGDVSKSRSSQLWAMVYANKAGGLSDPESQAGTLALNQERLAFDREREARRLKESLATLIINSSLERQSARQKSISALPDLLARAVPEGTQYVPGYEPGGSMSQIYGMMGGNFTPRRLGTYRVDPFGGQDQLQQDIAAALAELGR